mmetsp:Transcript_24932/g.49720  ORF Transcript_24932/g.49720 Transcript_24932/m.49720 type:complete len:263 (+) Transcript_24932:484-1272(+)
MPGHESGHDDDDDGDRGGVPARGRDGVEEEGEESERRSREEDDDDGDRNDGRGRFFGGERSRWGFVSRIAEDFDGGGGGGKQRYSDCRRRRMSGRGPLRSARTRTTTRRRRDRQGKDQVRSTCLGTHRFFRIASARRSRRHATFGTPSSGQQQASSSFSRYHHHRNEHRHRTRQIRFAQIHRGGKQTKFVAPSSRSSSSSSRSQRRESQWRPREQQGHHRTIRGGRQNHPRPRGIQRSIGTEGGVAFQISWKGRAFVQPSSS